ncbi:hypothetical protein GGR55DRAFT_345894 [Xylaria sp. FL0064]|nr:hypothetical protein GGR55DRAFT_345894 [Xylaria sp. FL0064]
MQNPLRLRTGSRLLVLYPSMATSRRCYTRRPSRPDWMVKPSWVPSPQQIFENRSRSRRGIFRDNEEAHRIAETTIQLIPLLTPRALKNTDKQHILLQAASLASDAAAIALEASKEVVAAIEMLETGRGILNSTVYDLRTDVLALQQHHPIPH